MMRRLRRPTGQARAAFLPAPATFWPWVLLVSAALLLAAAAQAATVTKADDVCASNANPCNVTSTMDIPNGLCTNNQAVTCSTNTDCTAPGFCKLGSVVLDFGTRDVVVSGAGQFNFAASSGQILAGNFTANTNGNAIDANSGTGAASDSGTVRIYSRRRCSGSHLPSYPAPACISNQDCQFGPCSVRRCSLGVTKTCSDDAGCQVGPCIQNGFQKTCQKDASRACLTNADCSLGTCPEQLSCKSLLQDRAVGTAVNCSSNTDCDFDECTVGTASITLNGGVAGNSAYPAFLDLRAADNITISKSINLNGSTAESDGGELSVDANFGSISVTGAITATSGGFSTGGDVSLYAGTDITVNSAIDISGGDYDGGTIDVDGGRDVAINRSINANSTAGAGYGGEFLVVAGRDLSVSGVSSANKTLLENSGNVNQFNEAGDGGSQDMTADRNLVLNVNTRLISNGANGPDAVGGDIILDASGDLQLSGDIVAKALAANGEGGTFEAYASGVLTVTATGTMDLTGGSADAGEMNLYSGGNMTFAGTADLGASNGGAAGAATLDCDADATVSGTLRIASGGVGDLHVNACRITLSGTGKLDSGTTSSDNRLTAHESMKLLSGSLMKTGTGTNTLVYRAASKPPQKNGTITPAPTQVVNPVLSPCPVCGNLEIDGGETCDDGNTANGDNCNSDCQNEKCVQQTAAKIACTTNADCGSFDCDQQTGFCGPWVLCEDGNVCTTDTCNTSLNGGTCQHTTKNCAETPVDLACTTDSCNPADGSCIHAPNDGACNDSNLCTNDTCNALLGCVFTANSVPCDDGDECTENDTCSAQTCSGTPIQGCGFCGDGDVNGDEVCDDGNATFSAGEYCGVDCAVLTPCGRPTATSGVPKSSDAQYTLRAAVGQVTCSLRVCDVDNTTKIVATDAQRILRLAVGQPVTLICPTTGS